MLNFVMLNVIVLSAVMVNVIMLSVVMVNVITLNAIMLNVIILSVVAPQGQLTRPESYITLALKLNPVDLKRPFLIFLVHFGSRACNKKLLQS